VSIARLQVERMTLAQDVAVAPVMALGGRDVSNVAVAVPEVVPLHESARPLPFNRPVREAARRYFAVRNRLRTNALWSDTRGREYESLICNQCSIASTVVAFNVAPLSP